MVILRVFIKGLFEIISIEIACVDKCPSDIIFGSQVKLFCSHDKALAFVIFESSVLEDKFWGS